MCQIFINNKKVGTIMAAALVTGASRGIGKSIALALASEGYDLIITCHKSLVALHDVQDKILEMNVRCLAIQSNVASYLETEQLFNEINNFTNNLALVVNNAAISHIGLLTDMAMEEWNKLVTTNLSGLFHTSKFAIPMMLDHKSGNIINISSVWGQVGASCEVAYSATKGGVNSFTKALAKELAPSGIRVNAIACGVIDTEMNQWLDEEDRQSLIEEIDLGRLGKPNEIANAVGFLASKKAGYITGQIITIDGGFI